eukprot:484840_1
MHKRKRNTHNIHAYALKYYILNQLGLEHLSCKFYKEIESKFNKNDLQMLLSSITNGKLTGEFQCETNRIKYIPDKYCCMSCGLMHCPKKYDVNKIHRAEIQYYEQLFANDN